MRGLALAGIVAPIWFTGLVVLQGFLQPDYSHVRLPISALAAWPTGWIQNVNFYVTGALTMIFAFALHRGDLLAPAMRDRIHQPYRMQACPLLSRLLPLSGTPGVLGVALSGAGPSVLLITEGSSAAILAAIRQAAQDPDVEIVETMIAGGVQSQ